MPIDQKPLAAPLIAPMPRAYAFFDGQNLFKDTIRQFGSTAPAFDPIRLANMICGRRKWDLRHVRFYTGVPDEKQNRKWSVFWANKRRSMERMKVVVETRKLNYKDVSVKLYDGVRVTLPDGRDYAGRLFLDDGAEAPDGTLLEMTQYTEKGIDVRIAVDLIRFFAEGHYDVGLLFTRDKDLAEAVDEVKRIAIEKGRTALLASAFPSADGTGRGVPNTLHLPFVKSDYDACLDPDTDKYFPKK